MNLREYYSILSIIQNRVPNIDIMTITAMMSDEEKLAHLFHYAFEVEGVRQ